MKKTKRILSFILALVVMFTASIVNVVSNAEETNDITIDFLTEVLSFEGHYYQVIKAKLNWEEAKEFCEELGGHLVTINSKTENDYMVEITKDFDNVNCIWLGAYRDRNAPKNEQWKWITEEEFSYKNWKSGEPNDYSGRENYLEMYVSTGCWNDTHIIGETSGRYSINYFAIICEWEKDSQIKLPNVTVFPTKKTEFNGHTYGMYTDKVSWDEAVEFCESQGGHLATITSAAENNAITSMLSAKDSAYWIGAECTNGVWEWITDETWEFTNWGKGEPAFMDKDHLCGRINCETTFSIEMRGYEFNYGDWDACQHFDAYKHTIPMGGFICEWENDTETDSKFGWSILNTKDSFGYDSKHRLSVIDYYSVNEYNLYTLAKTSAGTAWEGSCFGLSLLALADYNGQIDLSKYFSNIGSCLNEYGYQKIDEIVTKSGVSGKAYVLTGNDEIIKIIEKAQMSQFSDDIEKTEVFGIGSDISDFVEYCKSGNSPLLVTMKPAEHAVAVDPTRPVEQDKDGKYKIWLYDSNSPRISNKIDGQIELYNNQQSYLLVDTENNKWSYCYNGNEGSWYSHYSIDAYEGDSFKGWKTIRFFDISKLSQDFFTYELKMKKNAAIIRMTEDSSIEIKSFAETLFEFDYARYQIADKTYSYMPYYQENNDEDTVKSELGCLTLPAGNYTFTTDGEVSFLRFIEDDYIVSLSSDDDIIVDFDDENKNITIKNVGDKEVSFEFGIENIQNSSADVVKGKIEPEKEIYIDFSGSESDSASVITTTGKLDSITTSYIQNNEETDSHYHKCAYADSGHLKSDWITESAASCTQAGTKYTECTACHEKLSTEEIPATGHIDANKNNLCDNCGEKLKQEVDTNCNHICHTNNKFLKFIWTIFNFLMRLFSMERICTCGAAHY